MREATASLKNFPESDEGDKGETLAKQLWEVMLVSKDSYKEKYPSGGHSVTGGLHEGTRKTTPIPSYGKICQGVRKIGSPNVD